MFFHPQSILHNLLGVLKKQYVELIVRIADEYINEKLNLDVEAFSRTGAV